MICHRASIIKEVTDQEIISESISAGPLHEASAVEEGSVAQIQWVCGLCPVILVNEVIS
jgi:hypothetical protein